MLILDDDFVITGDQHNYQLQKWVEPNRDHHKTKENSVRRLKGLGYSGTLGGALKMYCNHKIKMEMLDKDSDVESLIEYLEVLFSEVQDIGDRIHYASRAEVKGLVNSPDKHKVSAEKEE